MKEKAMRLCEGGWNYCDGDCDNCAISRIVLSNKTDYNLDYVEEKTDYSVKGSQVVQFIENAVCECGGTFIRKSNVAFMTNSPQYEYVCNKCGREICVPIMYPRYTYKNMDECIDTDNIRDKNIKIKGSLKNLISKEELPDSVYKYDIENSGVEVYVVDCIIDTGVSHDKYRVVIFTNDEKNIPNLISRKLARRSDECLEEITSCLKISVANNLMINMKG